MHYALTSMLFILAFDHRKSFAHDLLGRTYPVQKKGDKRRVEALKQMVFDGFRRARKKTPRPEELGILIDEEFGAKIIREAKRSGCRLVLSVEKSGQNVFTFEYDGAWRAHLKGWKPHFAKALVRYDVREQKINRVQRGRLKALSAFCKKENIGLIVEVLFPHNTSLKERAHALREMRQSGIMPDIWKLEGCAQPSAWRAIKKNVGAARLILLGRGEGVTRVQQWIKAAAKSGVVDGFAIGRTIFFAPLKAYLAGRATRDVAIKKIARNFRSYITRWRAPSTVVTRAM